jgi:hypothetical protein
MLVNDTILLYAHFFQQGRKQDIEIVFENSDRTKADISPSGTITAIDGGTIRVSAVPEGFPEETEYTEIFIRRPDSILLTGLESQLMAGETLNIKPILWIRIITKFPEFHGFLNHKTLNCFLLH